MENLGIPSMSLLYNDLIVSPQLLRALVTHHPGFGNVKRHISPPKYHFPNKQKTKMTGNHVFFLKKIGVSGILYRFRDLTHVS